MGVLENLAKNPAVLGIAALGIVAFIFRDKISDFLSNITGGAATANILGENLLSNLEGTQNLLNNLTEFLTTNPFENFEFPTFEFPPFPTFDFGSFFENFFNGDDDDGPGPVPPGPIGDPPVELPPGCFIDDQGRLDCPSPPTFDVCAENPELCEPCGPNEERIGGICRPTDDFIGPPEAEPPIEECIEIPQLTGGTINSCSGEFTPPITPPTPPGPELPPGFVGGGPSFEGGSIFETTDESCTTLSCVLDRNPGFTASQAANRLAEILGTFGDFDFGTNTGSGFGPGDDPTGPLVTGGATLESEAKRAACVTCDLFGLNCPLCRGTI